MHFFFLIHRKQLQNALGEFDFLYHIDRQRNQQQLQLSRQSSPQPASQPITTIPHQQQQLQPPQQQHRPQLRLSPDIYHRPVLSMPPVILMGGGGGGVGGGGGGFIGGYNGTSIPPSPIVEMPPSPAPSQMMFIEYPDDDMDEVRFELNFFFFYFYF